MKVLSGSELALFICLCGIVAIVSFSTLPLVAALLSCLLGAAMIAIGIRDARDFLVPDELSLPAIPLGLLGAALLAETEPRSVTVLQHLGAAAAGALALQTIRVVYQVMRRQEGLGLGDVKLAAAAGAWTGFDGLSLVMLLACASALSYVFFSHAWKRTRINACTAVPLGAFLAPSIWLVWCLDAAMRGSAA
jgi:leader peptidase (prepilin peptidase)/N-methyltransferase